MNSNSTLLAMPFYAPKLVEIIIQSEKLQSNEASVLVAIGTQIGLRSFSNDSKSFNFVVNVNSESPAEEVGDFRLQVVKGSLFTYIWNVFARVDDEYTLEFREVNSTISANIWAMKGMDPWNLKIESGKVNWTNMRTIYDQMGIRTVGIHSFSKLLGKFLLCFPNYHKTQYLSAPMPASFMFNYMMTVTSCPCENLTSTSLLSQPDTFENRKSAVLAELILPDGTGSVLKGCKFRISSAGKLTLMRGDQNTTETKLQNLISRDVIRVVEVRSHPLGSKDLEIVVVIEVTSSSAEVKVRRYLTLDAERIASAVNGELNYCIELLDATEWNRSCIRWLEVGSRSVRSRNARLNNVDFTKSADWGSSEYRSAIDTTL